MAGLWTGAANLCNAFVQHEVVDEVAKKHGSSKELIESGKR